MGKYNTDWSKAKYERFIKEGRGQGESKSYKPWLTINDFPSLGRATRIKGWKTNRVHHFFSDLQTRYFYILDWSSEVRDIREHFPLLNIEETISDSNGLNFDAFKDKETGFPYVISTTFLITVNINNSGLKYIARYVKTSSELEKKLVQDNMEMQRRYWKEKGIDWGVVTNKDIPIIKAKNIEWIHSSLNLQDRGLSTEDEIEVGSLLKEFLKDSIVPLRKTFMVFDKNYGLEVGTALAVFKYLIASREVVVDMNKKIDLNLPVNQVIVSISESKSLKEVSS